MMQSVVFNAPPPNADFTVLPISGDAPLEIIIQGIDNGVGPITSWSWDFGDPSTTTDVATGIGPHNYTYTVDGTYTITLNYSGPGGSGSVSRQVGVYPASDPVQAAFSYELQGPDTGGFRVCFTNASTGPFIKSEWDFDNNGTFEVEDNNQVVCHIFSEGTFTVKLKVTAADTVTTSTATKQVNVVAAPVAAFNITPGANITWGTLVSFTDTSTGIITSWAWDFDGDGNTDSTTQNPSNISLTDLGANPIRLTVTGPGGSSYVEQIIYVSRLEITCNFNGNLNVLPSAGSQSYTSVIGNDGGRPITYHWTITGSGSGLPASFATKDINVDWNSIGYGSFLVTLEASTADGSSCNTSKTVNHNWQPLDCDTSVSLPGTLYANGQNYTFTANVSNINGRSVTGYNWTVNGSPVQSGASNTYTWTNTTDTGILPYNVTVSYTVTVDNGATYTPTTSSCSNDKSFTVQPWPTLTCNSISGTFTPLPTTPDNTTRSYNYTVSTSGTAGRTVSYSWSVVGGTITSANPSTNNQVTVRWDPTQASFPTAPQNENVSVIVTVTNPDSTQVACNTAHNVGVTVNHLVCNLPSGDVTPVVGETNNYTRNLANTYGRTITAFNWEIEQLTPVAASSTDPNHPLSFNFSTPGATYRIRYNTTVAADGGLPGDSCTSGWLDLAVYDTGVGFQCEGNLTGNTSPTNPASSFPYSLAMDNGNLYNLQYTYILTDYLGNEHTLGAITSTADGTISSPGFSLAALGPLGVDNYSLRVEVVEVGATHTTYSCNKSLNLTVGTLNANYSYNAGSWSNSAVPIGQDICFTNTSTATPGTIDTLNYTWNIGGNAADNSLGINTSTDKDLPGCMSFSQPGSYTVNLVGTTDSGLRTSNHSVTFSVYGLQSILIGHTGSSFAPSTQYFTATGTNISSGYSWKFYLVGNPTSLGSRTGASVNFPFSSAGTYKAVVSGTGPLGTTTAELQFTLLAPGSLAAGFRASQYGGVAPLTTCFTDTSVSDSQITQWEWDLDGDGSYELVYDQNHIPASICHTYSTPATSTTVRLRVTNSSFTDIATNVIRTYNLLESSVSFSVTPNGAGSYCFTAILPPGVTVTGWDFGDTITAVGQNYVCHTYGASGTYVVAMSVDEGGTTGTVVRTVEVTLGSGPTPDLHVSGTCSGTRVASFVVTNNGGAMTTPDQVIIRDLNGNVIKTDTLLLAAGGSTTFTVSDVSDNVTFETVDFMLSASTTCYYPPEISVAPSCGLNSLPIFTVTNNRPTDGPMAAPQAYEIRDLQNNLIDNGTFQLGLNELSVDIPVPSGNNPYETYTFTSTGDVGTFNVSHSCATPPVIVVTSDCSYPIVFTVTNTGGNMLLDQDYTIVDGSSNPVDSGSFKLAANGQTQFTLTGLTPTRATPSAATGASSLSPKPRTATAP